MQAKYILTQIPLHIHNNPFWNQETEAIWLFIPSCIRDTKSKKEYQNHLFKKIALGL